MQYKYVNEGEKALSEFPGLSREELAEVDRMFTGYIFFEKTKEGRRIWTSCCHQDGREVRETARTQTPVDRALLHAAHNERLTCPYCGRSVTVKNRKLLRSEWGLKEYHAVVFLHVSEDGETVWCQGYWVTKDFFYCPAGQPLYKVTRVYRFRRGEAVQWERDWYGEKMLPCARKRVQEPVTKNGLYGGVESYRIVGFERLQNSFLKYSWYDVPIWKSEDDLWRYTRKRKDLMRYLDVAAHWPENVEMLRKAGMDRAVSELVYEGKKNAAVLKWGETDPRKAFGLDKQELKEFLNGERDLDTLYLLKAGRKGGGAMTLSEAEEWRRELGRNRATEVLGRAAKNGVPQRKLLKYLKGFVGPRCHGGGVTLKHVAQVWCDYIDAAVKLGYDMGNPIYQMPRELDRKHDEATKAVRVCVEEELKKKAEEWHDALQKKYAFENRRFFIRAPYTAAEIVAEGKALEHCVGGYAERHASGNATILFLRSKAEPDKPYVTIQMRGSEIVQIHGYRNDRTPGARSPKVTHRKLLEEWVEWLKGGSRRDKQGNPILKKKKKKEESAA